MQMNQGACADELLGNDGPPSGGKTFLEERPTRVSVTMKQRPEVRV